MTPPGKTVTRVFADFLDQLATDKSIDPSVLSRLRETILVKSEIDPGAIREALFPKEKPS